MSLKDLNESLQASSQCQSLSFHLGETSSDEKEIIFQEITIATGGIPVSCGRIPSIALNSVLKQYCNHICSALPSFGPSHPLFPGTGRYSSPMRTIKIQPVQISHDNTDAHLEVIESQVAVTSSDGLLSALFHFATNDADTHVYLSQLTLNREIVVGYVRYGENQVRKHMEEIANNVIVKIQECHTLSEANQDELETTAATTESSAKSSLHLKTKQFPSSKLHNDPIYTITTDVWKAITDTIGKLPPESGGMLGGCRETNMITHFFFDVSADIGPAAYSPNVKVINGVLKKWNDEGLELVGMIHSHPDSYRQPSPPDLEYATRIMAACSGMTRFFMPIIITRPAFEFLPFHVIQNEQGNFLIQSCQVRQCISKKEVLHES